MLIIRITEDDLGACGDDTPGGGLSAYLAQHGVPPVLIAQALARLSQGTTVTLCKPSPHEAWEIWAGET